MATRNQVLLTFAGDASNLNKTVDGVGRKLGGLDSTANKTGGKLAGFAKKAALGLGGLAVAAGAVGLSFVKAAEESNKVTGQTEAVIKSMGLGAEVSADQIAKLSEKLSLKSGVDDELIQSGSNLLLTFGQLAKSAGETGGNFDRATQAALDMSVAMDTDMKSASIQVGKALNDPIRGLASLTRIGIQFTESQQDQIKAMVEAGDVAGAQALILAELEKQFGGSAEAQATASDKLGVAWGNLQETLGEKLLPVVEKFSTWVTDTGIPALESLIGWIEDNQTKVIVFAAVIGGVLVAAFVAWAAAIIAASLPLIAIGAIAGAVALLVVTHFDTMKRAFMGAFDWLKANWPLVLAILTGPIGLAVLAIFRHRDSIIGAFRSAFNFVKDMATGVKNWVVSRFNEIVSFFQGLPGRVKSVFSGLGRSIVDGFKSLWNNTIGGFGFTFGGFDPPGPGSIPGFSFHIPKLHQGGIMPGAPGTEGLALLQAGEHITRAGAPAGTVVNVSVQGSIRSDRDLVRLIRDELDRGGLR